jgi:Xaa-Pro dipeptidase
MGWPIGANREERLRNALAKREIDALLALTPENAGYLSRQFNYIATHWRIPGLSATVVNNKGERAIVAGDFGGDPVAPLPFPAFRYQLWTESVDVRGVNGPSIAERAVTSRPNLVARPEQFDLGEVHTRVVEAVLNVTGGWGRVGAELSHLPRPLIEAFQQKVPGIELVEAETLFDDLRALKDPDEIAMLRLAGELTEVGIAGGIERLVSGQNTAAVNALYQIAVHEQVVSDPRFGAFRQAEGAASIGIGADGPGVVGPGQTVKFDMQVDVGGYHSDIGRTVAFAPTGDQIAIYSALRNALAVAQERVRPGARFSVMYWAGTDAMVAAGFTNYSRGHLGHSVGLTQHFEEPPFIAPGETRKLVPGMVLSLELPYYVYGVGAFQLERMLLITEDGHEAIDRLPFEFDLGAG